VGDVIVSINGKEVSSIDGFRAATEKGDPKKGFRFVVESQGMERFAILRDSSGSDEE
jgi:S1-C subfamily serine protease